MNIIQKIVLTIWFPLSFIVLVIGFGMAFNEGAESFMEIVGTTFLILAGLGIPTLFLYKLWADKK
jgi:hypothetical protein